MIRISRSLFLAAGLLMGTAGCTINSPLVQSPPPMVCGPCGGGGQPIVESTPMDRGGGMPPVTPAIPLTPPPPGSASGALSVPDLEKPVPGGSGLGANRSSALAARGVLRCWR